MPSHLLKEEIMVKGLALWAIGVPGVVVLALLLFGVL
jgi:hypothetical protein